MIKTIAATMIAVANKVCGVSDSPASAHPRNTATTGFTYAYVDAIDNGVTRSNQVYALNATNDPKIIR